MFHPKLNAWLKGAFGVAALATVLVVAPVRAPALAQEAAAPAVSTPDQAPAQAPAQAATVTDPGVPPAEEVQEKGGLPQLDVHTFPSQLFWLALSFGALFILMSKVALPRVGSVLEARSAKISGDIDRAGQAKAQTESTIAAYEKALAEARQTAAKAIAESKAQADAEAVRHMSELTQSLLQRQVKAEEQIAAAKEAALSHVTQVAAEAATAAVAKLTGVDLAEDQVVRAVAGALKERA